MGEHQLTIPRYLHHAIQCDQQVLRRHRNKAERPGEMVEAIPPVICAPGKTAETVAPLLHPDSKVPTCKLLKKLAGRRDSILATSAVTGPESHVTD